MRSRLLQSDSFRHAALYAALFVGSMAVLIAVVYSILDTSFRANLLRESNDDLTSIHTAYDTARPGRALHEAKEMIDDRMLAPDADDVFLLQHGATKIAGNLPSMSPREGVVHLHLSLPARGPRPEVRTYIGVGKRLSPDDYAFVGQDMHDAKQSERGVLYTFGLVLVASLVLASGSGLVLSRSFLRRVDAITDTCRSIMAGRLGDRIPLAGTRNELERLGAAINDMLDRNQALMESLRQVSSDIAHDLRTPLTHLRYKLERARNEASDTGNCAANYAAAVDAAIADCDHLLSVFTALLRIAQIEAGARRAEFEDIDLTRLVERARDLYRPVMDDTGHPFEVATAPCDSVRGDRELLLQMISNLLDNAVNHTPSGARVRLSCGTEEGRARIVVADSGEGVPEADRANVFRRFYRREPSRTTPGSGLGLSLVSAVVDLHDATIRLEDAGPGLRVVVAFPMPKEWTNTDAI